MTAGEGCRPALRYLLWRGTVNRVRRRARRLRQPRYLLAMLMGVAYFVLIFAPRGVDPPYDETVAARFAGFAIALFLAWSWLWGGQRGALVFTPAETGLLLTAPIPRTALIRFKLLQVQPSLLFSALLLTLLTERQGPPFPLRFVAVWTLLTTINLHQTAASLVHVSAERQGRAGVRRNAVAILLFVLAGSALVFAFASVLPAVRTAADSPSLMQLLTTALQHPAARVATLPIRLVLAPTFASEPADWALAMLPAVGVLVAHYLWVIHTDIAYEEAAVEAGARRAARLAAVRGGRGHGPARSRGGRRRSLPMPRRGPPAVALVWKNVLTFSRTLRGPVLAFLLILGMAAFVGAGAAVGSRRLFDTLAIALLAVVTLLTVAGPLAIRNDLRRDLRHLQLLRTYPLTGRAIVRAEVASSTLTLTALQLLLILAALLLSALRDEPYGGATVDARVALIGVIVLPAVNALGSLIQNAFALLFPAWVRPGGERPGGVEFMGQHLLALFGALALLAIGLAAPALIAGGAFLAIRTLGTATDPATAAALALGTIGLVVEVLLCSDLLGRAFDRTDPADTGITAA